MIFRKFVLAMQICKELVLWAIARAAMLTLQAGPLTFMVVLTTGIQLIGGFKRVDEWLATAPAWLLVIAPILLLAGIMVGFIGLIWAESSEGKQLVKNANLRVKDAWEENAQAWTAQQERVDMDTFTPKARAPSPPVPRL